MNTISRNLTTYRAVLYEVDGCMQLAEVAAVEYVSTTGSRATAIQMLKSAGYDVPRGAIINIKELGTQKYVATLDGFLSVAEPVSE